jgi:hypothetical protein
MTRRVVAPDGTEWTVSRRPEPAGDSEAETARREEGRRFASSPLGWTLTAVGIVGLVVLSFVSPFAALGAVLVLAAVEVVDQLRRRRGRGSWLVEASSAARGLDHAWRVAGRRQSAAAVREVAAALERGDADPDLPGADRRQ